MGTHLEGSYCCLIKKLPLLNVLSKPSILIASVLTKIRNQDLQNMSIERYRHSKAPVYGEIDPGQPSLKCAHVTKSIAQS
jgi:hypothetical protein